MATTSQNYVLHPTLPKAEKEQKGYLEVLSLSFQEKTTTKQTKKLPHEHPADILLPHWSGQITFSITGKRE